MTLTSSDLLDRLRRATIGRYDVYAELGQGGMATVFLALDLALDRKVAIKVLNPSLATSADNVERFKREAKVAASLNHPNIIGIYAVGDDPSLAYFVMKYVEGRALDSVVRETGAQTVPFVRGVVAAAGKALHYAHTRGVVHRDVKPANFMLDRDGWLVVTDFGIAKMDDAKGLTLTGSVIGTPYYMAPEQFQGKPVTAAADQYALGVVAFELLTGRQPYAGETIGEVMKGHLFDPIPEVRSLRADVPEGMATAITRMLAKDPAERFPTLEDAVAAFGQVTETQEREVRTHIIKLAESGAMQQPQLSVPVSPSPPVRERRPTPLETDAHRAHTKRIDVPSKRAPSDASARGGHRGRTFALLTLALLIGGAAATAALRPDLVNRYRKQWFGGVGDAADTAAFMRSRSGQAAPEDTLALGVDSAKLAQAIRDSIEREVAQAMRDSLARVDSARRADSTARADSLRRARAAAANTRPLPPRRQAIRDSLLARREARLESAADTQRTPPRTETAVPAPQPPQPIPGTLVYGRILIGSRCPGAVLYLGDDVRPLTTRTLQDLQRIAGPVTIRVRTLAGINWDTTFTVEAGTQHRIGVRPVRCQ